MNSNLERSSAKKAFIDGYITKERYSEIIAQVERTDKYKKKINDQLTKEMQKLVAK